MSTAADLVRKCFAAYETKDRGILENILSESFTFTSPLDDAISRELYFERCWPNSEHIRSFRIERLFEEGNDAFVTYVGESTDGAKFQNTEFFKTKDGKIQSVEVYFGSETGKAALEEEVRALIDATVKACRAKDARALMACYAPDVVAFDLIQPLRYEGSDQVAKRAGQWFSSYEGPIEYELHDLKITFCNEAAFGYSLNHVIGITTEGQKVDMWWRATLCCAPRDGKWLITHAHNSEPFDMETGLASVDLKP